MEPRGLVCLNDRTGTRVNIAIGTDLAIDLTLITKSLAGGCSWEVMKESTVGSDRYPNLEKDVTVVPPLFLPVPPRFQPPRSSRPVSRPLV
uniref:Uncharacterized protein n=1 Tax=Anguilla anguilla TaxID=7936 RepID=A0A0E9RBC4_ANGAN